MDERFNTATIITNIYVASCLILLGIFSSFTIAFLILTTFMLGWIFISLIERRKLILRERINLLQQRILRLEALKFINNLKNGNRTNTKKRR